MKIPAFIPLLFSVCIAGSLIRAKNVGAEFIDTMEFGLHSGLRLDQIDWNIAGNLAGKDPNVLSELVWKDLEIRQLGLTAKLAVGNEIADYRTYIRGTVDYGWITDGTVRDSDYNGDNRTQEDGRWLSATQDDNVLDGSLGLGFEKKYWRDRCTLGWLGGYSYHEQNLRLSRGMQLIPTRNPIPGLDSTYENKWSGPFAGLDLELRPSPHFSLFVSVEYHWSNYKAQANWNLRNDLAHPVSFRHEADQAEGVVGTLRGRYRFNNGWLFDLAFEYRDFSARDGIDRTFFANGTTQTTKLNEVNWQSSATTVGFTYRF